jgi:hypothetical protein
VPEDTDFSDVARRVIHRDRTGYRLLAAYYLLAIVIVVVSCAVQPAEAGIVIGGIIAIGVILLTDVSVSNQRALRPLRENWPQLAMVPAQRRNGRPGAPTRPHKGTGIFYVIALLLVAAAGGLTMSIADAAAASATTQVTILSCNDAGRGQLEECTARWVADGRTYQGTISWASETGTEEGRYNPKAPGAVYSASVPYLNGLTILLGVLIIVMGPVCALVGRIYQRNTRGPYLAALEDALAKGDVPRSPAKHGAGPGSWFADSQPATASGPTAPTAPHRHRRIGELIWVGLFALIVVGRLGTLVALGVESAGGGGAGGSGTVVPASTATASPASSPYPVPEVKHGVVTDSAAGITYSDPPGTGWSEDTDPVYPPEGAEFTAPVPGYSDDEASIVSAPLPSNVSFTGASDLRSATLSYASYLAGTYYSAHNDTVLAYHGFSVCRLQAWLIEFRVHYTSVKLPDENAALVVINLGGNRRPGTLFATIAVTMDSGLTSKIAQSVRPAGGCLKRRK